jgi:hypothetical protein
MMRGEIKEGKAVGIALAFYEIDGGETYFGEVLEGKRHGSGTLLLPNNDIYFGEFEAGDPSGYGTFLGLETGDFVGVFAKGAPNGHGTFLAPSGAIYQGRFIDGKPDGLVLVTGADGAQTTETWKHGEKAE